MIDPVWRTRSVFSDLTGSPDNDRGLHKRIIRGCDPSLMYLFIEDHPYLLTHTPYLDSWFQIRKTTPTGEVSSGTGRTGPFQEPNVIKYKFGQIPSDKSSQSCKNHESRVVVTVRSVHTCQGDSVKTGSENRVSESRPQDRPCSVGEDCLTGLSQRPLRGARPRELFLCERSVYSIEKL
jgi:hypothetical protein